MSIDISRVPKPQVIDQPEFDQIVAELSADLVQRYPACADVIDDEAEPLLYLLQTAAYRELVLRQRVNDAALNLTLAYASNTALDAIGTDRFKLPRLVVRAADNSTNPPTPAVMEHDDDYRQRLWLSMDALSTAGPQGAYESLAFNADADIADARALKTAPGTIVVYVVSDSAQGQASAELVQRADAAVSDDDQRVMTDNVSAQAASITPVVIDAVLHLQSGIDSAGATEVLNNALNRANALQQRRKIGEVLAESKIYAALHVEGVEWVEKTSPAADVDPGPTGAAVVSAVNVTLAGA